jgi:hypothetical protein
MRSQVDGAVEVHVVTSPSSGAYDLAAALLRWPAMRELTLLNVSVATDLAPLSTASLAGLTSLTVREVGGMDERHAHGRHANCMARSSSRSAACMHRTHDSYTCHGIP